MLQDISLFFIRIDILYNSLNFIAVKNTALKLTPCNHRTQWYIIGSPQLSILVWELSPALIIKILEILEIFLSKVETTFK